MPSKKLRRNQKQTQTLSSFERLEPRQLLATTLYVDFGFQAGSALNISDAQSSQYNGPQIFGSGYGIDSFTQGVIDDGLDTNDDGVVDAVDAENLAEGILTNLNRILMPFEIDVTPVGANSLADIATSLSATTTQDAYIFVGGTEPVALIDNGEALIDLENTQDNLGFVFSHDFFSDASTRTIDAEVFIARGIAKQAGHTYGLRAVEGGNLGDISLNMGSLDDVMAETGTTDDGSFYATRIFKSAQSYFTNFEMPLAFENGSSPGTQNSFELMATNVGIQTENPAYLTGNSDGNEIEITSVSESVVNVSIDGQAFSNIDVTNGLWIETGRASSQQTVRVDTGVTAMVTINSPGNIETFGGPAFVSITTSSGGGLINGNIEFDSATKLVTGDANDEVTLQPSSHINGIDTGGGDDQVTLEADSRVPRILLGDGDDHLINKGGLITAEFGGSNLDGGAGIDTWDYSFNETQGLNYWFNKVDETGYSMTSYCNPRDIYCGTSYRLGMERIIGSQTQSNKAYAKFHNSNNKLTWVVDGGKTTVTDQLFEHTLEFIGFDEFGAQATEAYDPFTGQYFPPAPLVDDFFVLATSRDTVILDAALVQISSNLNPELGTTDTIDADVRIGATHLGMVLGEITTQIHVSDRLGTEPMSALLGEADAWGILSGATDANVELLNNMRYLITIDGTENHADVFNVNYNFSNLWLNGHGGDDLFFMGSTAQQADGQLDYLQQQIRIDGGAGNDLVHLNNQGGETGIDLRLSGFWLTPLAPESTNFVGVGIADLEVVRFQGSQHAEHLRVYPAPNTRFILDANGPEGAGGDYLETKIPFSPSVTHRSNQDDGGVWSFTGRQFILHKGFEKLSNVNFFATSSQVGQPTSVRIYDARSLEFQRQIFPFGADYLGGANTAWADVNYDGVPELIVAPKAGSAPIVKVFDVFSGELLTSFTPYGVNYRDGIHVSTGNVTGDDATEIVTSRINGVPIVRVFKQVSDQVNYRMHSQHRPFNDTFTSGASIAVADMNWDGYADVVSGAGQGELPQVAIHDVSKNDKASTSVTQLNRFMVVNSAFRGGVNVAVGNWFGNPKPELFIGVGVNEVAATSFSGKVYAYQGERLSRNAPLTVLSPDHEVVFESESTSGLQVSTLDTDLDGKIDRVIASNTKGPKQFNLYQPTDRFRFVGTLFA